MKKIFTKKTFTFFISLLIVAFVFLFLSYNFFASNYQKIEYKQNKKHLSTFFTLFNENFPKDNEIDNKEIKTTLKLASNIFDFTSIHKNNQLENIKLNKKIQIKNYSSNIDIYINYEKDFLINYIVFLDENKNSIFILKTKTYRDLVKEGKTSLNIFTGIVTLFLLLIFIISYFYKKNIKRINDTLEEKVRHRTKQIHHALNELEKVNLKLYDLAHTDYLTQIKNRRSFFMYAKELFNHSKNIKNTLCVVMIDIDNFKHFNDTYGHEAGDKILKKFTDTIKKSICDVSVFGRLGGEEFAIVLPSSTLEDAQIKAETIRQNIEKLHIKVQNKTVQITASFGIADSQDSNTIDEVIRKADEMLYSAKNNGKNRVRSRLS